MREKHLWIQFKKSNRPFSRLGVIATKRLGNAVKRNRAKRLLRELFRVHHHTLIVPCDLVIIARSSLFHAKYTDLETSFINALNKASMRL
jgi:ribonuclease P protein component